MRAASVPDACSEAGAPERLGVARIVVLGALSGFAPLSIDTYLPGLPALERHFHAGAAAAQLTLTGCLVGLALGQLLAGPLSDRVGRRTPLLVGVAVFVAASLACAASPSLWLFIAARVVQGLSGAVGIVLSRAVVRDVREGIGALRLFARLQLVNGLFPAIAPVLGAELLLVGSFRLIFVVLAALGVVLLVATALAIGETLPVARRRVASASTTWRSMGLVLRDRGVLVPAFVAGFVFAAMFAYISGSPFVLEGVFGLTKSEFSGVFAMNAIGIMVGGQAAAMLARRIGTTTICSLGVSSSALGAGLLVLDALGHLGLGPMLVGLFLVVSSVGIVLPSATALAMANHPDLAGSASGVLGVLQFVIGAASAPLVGAFGVRSPLPMACVIAALAAAALVLDRTSGAWSIRRG